MFGSALHCARLSEHTLGRWHDTCIMCKPDLAFHAASNDFGIIYSIDRMLWCSRPARLVREVSQQHLRYSCVSANFGKTLVTSALSVWSVVNAMRIVAVVGQHHCVWAICSMYRASVGATYRHLCVCAFHVVVCERS